MNDIQILNMMQEDCIPKYAALMIKQSSEATLSHHLNQEQLLLLQELYQGIKVYDEQALWAWYSLIKQSASHMEIEEWCYLCELLIAEVNGWLPLFDFQDHRKK